jgi:anti-anti-sigma regulatory factor
MSFAIKSQLQRASSNRARRIRKKKRFRVRHERLERHRIRRKGIRLTKLLDVANGLAINESNINSIGYSYNEKKLDIILPESLDFELNYESTASHLRVLRKAVEKGTKIRRIDFSRIKTLSTSAALVLASTVDQWRERVSGKIRAELPTWGHDIQKLLCQMGYFELLGLPVPEKTWDEGTVTFLPFIRGRIGEDAPGEKAKQLRIKIEEIVGKSIQRRPLFEGISEAITNVCQHAYDGVSDEKRKYWWLSASFDSVNRELRVTFYDKGLGIPKTLPAHRNFERFLSLFGSWPDSKKIEAAMKIGRTASGLEERGKGLQNLIEFAKAHPEGNLRVSSLKGTYEEKYENGLDNQQKRNVALQDHKCSIGGTLIEWSVLLP